MPLKEALANLGRAAAELQAETEALNAGITALDEALTQLGAGVTIWLERGLPEQEGWVLGYARVAGRKGLSLAVRQGEEEHMALIHAPRHVRVAAVALFGELVAALTARTCEHTDEIRAACAQLPI